MNTIDGAKTAGKDTSAQQDGSPPVLLREALTEIQASYEELRVAEEELRAQNEALAEAALALQAERGRYRDLFYNSPDPSLLTDLNGVIQEANPAAQELLAVGPRSLLGKPLAVFVALDSRRSFRSELIGQKGVRESGIYLQPKKGGLVYATLRASPVPDAGGSPVGLRWVVRGATSDPGAELARHRRLMNEVRDFGIFTMDADGKITSWNAGAEVIFGWSASEAVGKPASLIFTPEDLAAGALELEMGQAGAMGRAEDERWHLRKDGSRLWGSGVMTALRDAVGGPPWYAKIVRDLTERRLREQREHAVATQLQASVQPAAPPRLPGIAVRTFYRPASKDMSIGGDFFDAFGLGDARSILVVGDVSGHGLEAASQVSTVRNMLRAHLYNALPHDGQALAECVTALNRTLTLHGLLTGIVTLFLGMFDPEAAMLSYVNCGQEPAMVRRAATSQIEALTYTGPVLGLDSDSEFSHSQVILSPRDVLTILTDGLTDIGPSRTEMLGEQGVTDLLIGVGTELDGVSAQRAAELMVARLVRAVDAQTPENMPDDICVLVAVVEA